MRAFPNSQLGFSLVEVLVATVILALVVVGMMGVFVSGNKHILHARERMVVSELSKLFIDPLKMAVRGDTWDDTATNALTPGVNMPLPNQTVNNRTFTAVYTVNNVNVVGTTPLRRVRTTVSWEEPDD